MTFPVSGACGLERYSVASHKRCSAPSASVHLAACQMNILPPLPGLDGWWLTREAVEAPQDLANPLVLETDTCGNRREEQTSRASSTAAGAVSAGSSTTPKATAAYIPTSSVAGANATSRAANSEPCGSSRSRPPSPPTTRASNGAHKVPLRHLLTIRVLNGGKAPEYVHLISLESESPSPITVAVRRPEGTVEVRPRDQQTFELKLDGSHAFARDKPFWALVRLANEQTFCSEYGTLGTPPHDGQSVVIPDPEQMPDDQVGHVKVRLGKQIATVLPPGSASSQEADKRRVRT